MDKDMSLIRQIAKDAGIADAYTNAWGQTEAISEETQLKLLDALGYDVSNESTLSGSAKKRQRTALISPVCVLRSDEPKHIVLHLGVSARVSDFSWRLTTETGEVLEGYLESELVKDSRKENGLLAFSLPDALPLGYHNLEINRKRRKSPITTQVICAPARCYQPKALQQGQKMWGPSVQLYTLKSQQNWGMGDFSDLKFLIEKIADNGGDFVGLNPIHALFPANPEAASPYSPSSRRWLNCLYIDLTAIEDYHQCPEAKSVVQSAEFTNRKEQARNASWVNYSEVADLKFTVFPLLYQRFKQDELANESMRAKAFRQFVEEGGESLLSQSAFDALHGMLKETNPNSWGWPAFPEKYRHFSRIDVQRFIKDHPDRVELHMYLQWIASQQLAAAQQSAIDKGMAIGIYRDLAVGVADAGAETWADEGALCLKASIGAPPDVLGPQGQNWGLPPFNPDYLKAHAYKPFIDLLRANMTHCGALRIDHVLGLLRLWWIPKGDNAQHGAYIYHPVEELLAILALESQRHQCCIIGEDLGTVPEEIRALLSSAGIYSYKVFFFETAPDGGFYSPKHYPAQSMAALCTHDMPTLRGFWHCEDIKLGEKIGLYQNADTVAALFDGRLKAKQRILESVNWHGYLPDNTPLDASVVAMDTELNNNLQRHLAAGNSALLSLQLEDWLEMENPVNIPGTVDEYPNWRRKLSKSLNEIFDDPACISLMETISSTRQHAREKGD